MTDLWTTRSGFSNVGLMVVGLVFFVYVVALLGAVTARRALCSARRRGVGEDQHVLGRVVGDIDDGAKGVGLAGSEGNG